jgi:hypothetical protein
LNISGQITLEAWIKPNATQGDPARIISHGPQTRSDFLGAATIPDNSLTNTSEVFLRIDGAGANYVVGSTAVTYTNSLEISSNIYSASFQSLRVIWVAPIGFTGSALTMGPGGSFTAMVWRSPLMPRPLARYR